LDDDQTQLGRKRFNVLASPSDELIHGQLGLKGQAVPVLCFLFSLFDPSSVLSHGWFSWLVVSFSTAHPVRWTAGEPPPIPTTRGTFPEANPDKFNRD
jgi:hypothetical protein